MPVKPKFKIKKGDYVQVIAGDEKGKRGKVLRVLPKKHKVIVEGINYVYKHIRRSQKATKGGRIQKEAPIDISNVMIIDPHTQSPTKIGYKFIDVETKEETSEGKTEVKKIKVRYSKKSNSPIERS